ncbi:hypothetical protein [Paenibacillus alvei]|uniref:hypothetical protein n=1 Tax=Paenibacillus alvei TaxID=44250 RepID=UPI0022802CD3|nr:hypothetical protein [Paenibacillus alvei]MCY7484964.1 hypothetical protein [Paenibacillus alvei]
MIFTTSNGTHPILGQDFIWVADYYDGTHLCEYDLETKESDPYRFYSIDRMKLLRFGLIGHSSKLFFEAANGVFNINGEEFRISYVENDKEYLLNGRSLFYNDIISYKDAVSEANPFQKQTDCGMFTNRITQYNFGYKKKLSLDGVTFNFQAIVSIPYQDKAYMSLKIASDQELDGKIVIQRRGIVVDEIESPLQKGHSTNITWTLK